MHRAAQVPTLALAAVLVGCPATPPALPGPGIATSTTGAHDDAGTSSSGDATGGDSLGDATGGSGPTDGGGSETSEEGDDGPTTGCGSSPQRCLTPSTYAAAGDCDPYAQDCPIGEKCSPTSIGGRSSTACVPVSADALQPGMPCRDTGRSGDGVDNCDVGLVCTGASSATPVCTPLCGCGPETPTCPGQAWCNIFNSGTEPICLRTCDPFQQDCGTGVGCYPTGDGAAFLCLPDLAASAPTTPGDSCSGINDCSPGQVCSALAPVSGCTDPIGCCTELCDTSDAAACAGTPENCFSWWADGSAPADCPPRIGYCRAL